MNQTSSKAVYLLLLLLIITAGAASAQVYRPDSWRLAMGGADIGGLAFVVGATPTSTDQHASGYIQPSVDWRGVFTMQYLETSPAWPYPTGFYAEGFRAPLSPGGSKTWSDIYLWSQSVTLAPANRVAFATGSGFADKTPYGCLGHLVLDYVPTECNWTGPTEFWLDLAKPNDFILPTIVTADPLQGTRMHLTVYAPVPEPTSLAALATGLTAIGGFTIKRRKA